MNNWKFGDVAEWNDSSTRLVVMLISRDSRFASETWFVAHLLPEYHHTRLMSYRLDSERTLWVHLDD